MNNRDEHLDQALRKIEGFDVTSIEDGFAEITLSPLGELIESLLPNVPTGTLRDVLERLRNLKQGRLEDLSDPEFQSFLVSYLSIDLSLLLNIARILRTHRDSQVEASDGLGLAARGTAAIGISHDELGKLLSQRQFQDE